MTPLVSIIIPVYKVEEYLDECVKSVINQTYTNLEIILVDDGSPDRCPQMCDEWANRDDRICVVHKSNGGLSDARNAGMDVAKGEYISFVDSDDFVEPTYIEKMYEAMLANPDCSIVSSRCQRYVNGVIKPIFKKNWIYSQTRYIEPEDYADRMLLTTSQHTAWGKLYKADILKNIRFRKGYINEDILFVLDFYPYVEKNRIRTVEIPDILYTYHYRRDSITYNEGGTFHFHEFRNYEIVMKATKGKKPKVYEHYYLWYLKRLCDMIMWKLNDPSTYPCSYFYLSRKTWRYSNSYAKEHLTASEYSTFLHGKYLAPLIWLKYRL